MNKIAAIQMCSSSVVEENLRIADNLIREAATSGAQLVVLPEMFAVMGNPIDKVRVREAMGEGKIQSFLSNTARNNAVWVVGGTIPIACTDPYKIRAASLVFNGVGECVARYDKIHLFDVNLSENEVYKESDTTESGNEIIVLDTPLGRLGLAVCYDVRFPLLFRNLLDKGVQIISLPSAFTLKTGKAHWELLARSRAVENGCYIIGACQGGLHGNGRETYGHSLIVDPWGDIIARKEDDSPGVIDATVDLNYLNKIRASIPVLEHQRNFVS